MPRVPINSRNLSKVGAINALSLLKKRFLDQSLSLAQRINTQQTSTRLLCVRIIVMRMNQKRFTLATVLYLLLFLLALEAKTLDPYKVLGVERNASQREIQKAFHKLSLQYHPDKNKNKNAHSKFAEINNAYEILSDEEKRKNYDMYGDEKGQPGFGGGTGGFPGGDQGGYTYYSSGGPGQNGFNFGPGDWQNMDGQGGSKSFSFSFGGPSSSGGSYGFGLDDIFSNLFGGGTRGGQFGGSGGSSWTHSRTQSGSRKSASSIRAINSQIFKNEVADQGMTWLLLFHTSALRGSEYYESIVQEVADLMQGAIKVGRINCETEGSLCKELSTYPRKAPRVFVCSYRKSDKGSLVEYNDDLVVKNLKTFCQDHLPRFSKRVSLKEVESLPTTGEKLPRVLLLSTKKDTPVIWRVLSGLYHKRFVFNDVEVHNVDDAMTRKLGVDALPAIVGWLSSGEKHVLKTGISVKDLKTAVRDLSALLHGFEKKNEKVASRQASQAKSDPNDKYVPMLTASNFNSLCGETTPVCIIGVFRSSKAKQKLESILSVVSQKSLSRGRNMASGSKDSISYSLLDTTKQSTFLNAFEKSGFKSSDKLLLAYKPRRGSFVAYEGDMMIEKVEEFISSVLNGDVQFNKTRQKPVVK